jgi:hypothetical protein
LNIVLYKGGKSAIAYSACFTVAFTYLPTVRYQGNFWGVKGDRTASASRMYIVSDRKRISYESSQGKFIKVVKRAIAQVRVLRKCTGVTAMRSQPMFQNHK